MRILPLLSLLALGTGWATATHTPSMADAESSVRAAAVNWWKTLDGPLREQAVFPLDDPERRAWSNLPHTMFARQGVAFGEMDDVQRRAAHHLLRTLLSSAGYHEVAGIMRGDDILMSYYEPPQDGSAPRYGHDYYWLALFGDPSGEGPWGLQLDGHHLALNVTAHDGEIRVTPTFLGGNPVQVATGPYAGWQVMAEHDELGLQLARSLTPEQRKKAVIAETSPGDVLAGPTKGAMIGAMQGIPIAELELEQRQWVEDLVRAYVGTYRREVSAQAMNDFRKDLEEGMRFAWLGPIGDQEPYAYRLHGPRTWIEFSNVQGAGSQILGMNHIHAVWRRIGDDYGDAMMAADSDGGE